MRNDKMTRTRVVCPECKAKIEPSSQLEIGDEVTCSRCEADWKVVSRAPLVLDWIDEVFDLPGAKRWTTWNVRADKVPAHRLRLVE